MIGPASVRGAIPWSIVIGPISKQNTKVDRDRPLHALNRRELIKYSGLLAGGLTLYPYLPNHAELSTDVVIIGGGVGGCAAALAAARSGVRVIMTEETDWIGGQLTQQAVPPDEHPWIERFGATRSYRAYRKAIREYYRAYYPLRGEVLQDPFFNPGACSVSYLCHEPRAAHAVLQGMMAPFISSGQLTILLDTISRTAQVSGDRVVSIEVEHTPTGNRQNLTGAYFLDATEMGDLLPMTGTEYITGAESQAQTGELHAPNEAQPQNMQAPTWCFAIDYMEGENHTIDKPANYDFWRDYTPELSPPWSGKLLSLTYSNPITLEPRTAGFDPRQGAVTENFNLWSYRRLIAPSQLREGALQSGISLINWPQNDYLLGNLYDVPAEEATQHHKAAMEVSYALLYWLQTEAPREDGGAGWPGLRLRGDVCGTTHGLAKRPYIREARRIKAVTTITEQHVGLEARMAATGQSREEVTAASFNDAIGIGSYRIDLHPSTGGDNYIDISSLPFEIPLGALIPQRMENLLPACKNLGVTHITNGCYRLHPVEWNIGEAAGLTAAHCISAKQSPRHIQRTEGLLHELQGKMTHHGIELRWPNPMRTAR